MNRTYEANRDLAHTVGLEQNIFRIVIRRLVLIEIVNWCILLDPSPLTDIVNSRTNNIV